MTVFNFTGLRICQGTEIYLKDLYRLLTLAKGSQEAHERCRLLQVHEAIQGV